MANFRPALTLGCIPKYKTNFYQTLQNKVDLFENLVQNGGVNYVAHHAKKLPYKNYPSNISALVYLS